MFLKAVVREASIAAQVRAACFRRACIVCRQSGSR